MNDENSPAPSLVPIPAPSLERVADHSRTAAGEIKAEAERLRLPLADLLARLALEGWTARQVSAGPVEEAEPKRWQDVRTPRDFERLLKEIGASNAEAKRITLEGYKPAAVRKELAEVAGLADRIRRAAAILGDREPD